MEIARAQRIVVEAVRGRRAAKSIDRFLNGKDLKEGRLLEAEGIIKQSYIYQQSIYLKVGIFWKKWKSYSKIVNGENLDLQRGKL